MNIESIDQLDEARDHRYAFPGGYPTFFITADGAALCHDCVGDNIEDITHAIEHDDTRSGWRVNALDVNWEDPHLYCDDCGKRIESAYAEDQETI